MSANRDDQPIMEAVANTDLGTSHDHQLRQSRRIGKTTRIDIAKSAYRGGIVKGDLANHTTLLLAIPNPTAPDEREMTHGNLPDITESPTEDQSREEHEIMHGTSTVTTVQASEQMPSLGEYSEGAFHPTKDGPSTLSRSVSNLRLIATRPRATSPNNPMASLENRHNVAVEDDHKHTTPEHRSQSLGHFASQSDTQGQKTVMDLEPEILVSDLHSSGIPRTLSSPVQPYNINETLDIWKIRQEMESANQHTRLIQRPKKDKHLENFIHHRDIVGPNLTF